ncbi:MAG: gliding motility-associated C-terminal domain-containing protein [Salinivirgaceae bacterium]|nr:gliding motility-associated C-terminal domain-containing protein [Salinivirgaceae bacterium]
MKRHIFTVSILLVAAQLFGQESRFWVGGSGSWTDESHWSTTSGGEPGASVPESGTSVVFDENSFSGARNTVSFSDAVQVGSFTATDANFALSGKKDFTVSGSINVDSDVDFGKLRGALVLSGKGSNTLSLPTTLRSDIVIEGGKWSLESDLTTDGNITINGGSFTTNGHNITCAVFTANEGAKFLNIEKSNIVCDKWLTRAAKKMAVKAAGSDIAVKDNSEDNIAICARQSYNSIHLFSAAKTVTVEFLVEKEPTCPDNAENFSEFTDGKMAIQFNNVTGPYWVFVEYLNEDDKLEPVEGVPAGGLRSNYIPLSNLKAGSYRVRYYTSYPGGTKLIDKFHNLSKTLFQSTFGENQIKVKENGGAECWGDDIVVEPNVSGGALPYIKYEWWAVDEGEDFDIDKNPGEVADYFSLSPKQSALLRVTDNLGCKFVTDDFFYYFTTEDGGYNKVISSYTTGPELIKATFETEPSCEEEEIGSITITATGGTAPYTYHYSKDGGTEKSTSSNIIEGLSAGTYTIRVEDSKIRVEDGKGCTNLTNKEDNVLQKTVYEYDKAVAYINNVDNDSVCKKANTYPYTATKIDTMTYTWDVTDGGSYANFSGGSVTGVGKSSATLNLTDGGNTKVRLIVTNKTCKPDTATRTLHIIKEPKPTITSEGGDSCMSALPFAVKANFDIGGNLSGGTLELVPTSSPTGGKAECDGLTIKNVTKAGEYKFKVKQIDKKACEGISDDDVTYTFYDVPVINSLTASSTTACAGDEITITATITNQMPTVPLVWEKNGVAYSAAAGLKSFKYTTSASDIPVGQNQGTVTFKVKVSNGICDVVEKEVSVTVNRRPSPTIKIDGGTYKELCSDGTATITVTGRLDNSSSTFKWDYDKNNLDISNDQTNNPTVTFKGTFAENQTEAGPYNIKLTETLNGCSNKEPVGPVTVKFHQIRTLTFNDDKTSGNTCATIPKPLTVKTNCDITQVNWAVTGGKGTPTSGTGGTFTYTPKLAASAETLSESDEGQTVAITASVVSNVAACPAPAPITFNLDVKQMPRPTVAISDIDAAGFVCGLKTDAEAQKTIGGDLSWSWCSTEGFGLTSKSADNKEVELRGPNGVGCNVSVTETTTDGCSGTSELVRVSFRDSVKIELPEEVDKCVSDIYAEVKATVKNATSVVWSSSNSGNLTQTNDYDDDNFRATRINTAKYTFDPSDGPVTLKVTATNGVCPTKDKEYNFTVNPIPNPKMSDTTEICGPEGEVVAIVSDLDNNSREWSLPSGMVKNGEEIIVDAVAKKVKQPIKLSNANNYVQGPVVIIEKNPAGCDAKDTTLVIFKALPVIAFDPKDTAATICAGESFTIHVKTHENFKEYTWVSTSGVVDPGLHSGTFNSVKSTAFKKITISASPKDGCPSEAEAKMTLTINPMPEPNIKDTTICGLTYVWPKLTSVTGISSSNSWAPLDEPEGMVYSSTKITLSKEDAISVVLTESVGKCLARDTAKVTFVSRPEAFAGSDTAICASDTTFELANATASFYNNKVNDSLTWTTSGTGTFVDEFGGDGTHILNPIYKITPADTAAHTITLTLTAKSRTPCKPADDAEASITIDINPLPLPKLTGNDTVCASSSGNYKTDEGMSKYVWKIGSDTVATTESLNYLWKAAGNYNLSVTYTDGNGCEPAKPKTLPIVVNKLPGSKLPIVDTVCTNGSIVLNATDSLNNAPVYNYSWTDLGGGSVAELLGGNDGIAMPTFASLNTGTYTLVCTIEDGNSCEHNDTIAVTVVPGPVADAGKDFSVCYGDTAQLHGDYKFADGAQWISLGDAAGKFINEADTATQFIPGPDDWELGYVELALIAKGTRCGNDTAKVILTLHPELQVMVGTVKPFDIAETTKITVEVEGTYEGGRANTVAISLVSPDGTEMTLMSSSTVAAWTIQPGPFKIEFTTESTAIPTLKQFKALQAVDTVFGIADKSVIYGKNPAEGGWAVKIGGIVQNGGKLFGAKITFTDHKDNIDTNPTKTITFDSKAIDKVIPPKKQLTYRSPIGLNESCFGMCDAHAVASGIGGAGAGYTFTWINDITGAEVTPQTADGAITMLCAGDYTVTVTDGNQCSAFTSVHVGAPEKINISQDSIRNVACHGGSDGYIGLSASKESITHFDFAMAGFNVASSNDTSATFSGLPWGNGYKVIVTDEDGCHDSLEFNITQPDTLEITSATVTKASSCVANNGEVTFEVKGGSGNYVLEYVGDAADQPEISIDSLTATNIKGSNSVKFRIRDVDALLNLIDCFIDTTINTARDTLVVSLSPVENLCAGDEKGSITASVSNGSGKYTYQWLDGDGNAITDSTSSSISKLKEGTYSLYVLDTVSKCDITSKAVTLTDPEPFKDTIIFTQAIKCYGDTVAAFYAKAEGGTPDKGSYKYTWLDVNKNKETADSVLSNAGAGTYIVMVTDSNKCQISDTVTIAYPDTMYITGVDTTRTDCGTANGTAIVNVVGGLGDYEYKWHVDDINGNVVGVSDTAKSLGVNYYVVEVTDSLGCNVVSNQFMIEDKGGITVHAKPVGDVICTDRPTGQAIVDAIMDETTFKYFGADSIRWTGTIENPINHITLSVDDTAKVLPYGENRVWVYADNGCTGLTTVKIGNSNALKFDLLDHNTFTDPDITGAPNNDGVISMVVKGGKPGYTYTWKDSVNDIVLSDNLIGFDPSEPNRTRAIMLAEGYYTLVVEDQNLVDGKGCRIDTTIKVEYKPIVVAIDTTNVKCYGEDNGRLQANATGGKSNARYPYVYEWRSELWSADSVATTATIDGLIAGTYTLKVSQGTGWRNVYDTITVIQPSTRLNIPIMALDSAGSYCYNSIGSITIKEPNSPSDLKNAFSGALPFTYYISQDGWTKDSIRYSGTNPKVEGLASGTYNVKVVDSLGCHYETEVIVPDLSKFTVTSKPYDPKCFGYDDGAIEVTTSVVGGTGYKYLWSNGDTTQNIGNLVDGKYDVKVTATIDNEYTCEKTDTIELIQPNLVTFSVSSTIANSCYNLADGVVEISDLKGGSINKYKRFEFFAKSGEYYEQTPLVDTSWVKFEQLLPTGDYKVVVMDAQNNCVSDSVPLRVYSANPEIMVLKVDLSLPLCDTYTADGAVSIDGSLNVTAFYSVSSTITGVDTIENTNLRYQIDGGKVQSSGQFNGLASGRHTITIGYGDTLSCSTTVSRKLGSRNGFAIDDIYFANTQTDEIFTCPDNELKAFAHTTSAYTQMKWYTPYVEEEEEEEPAVAPDTTNADSTRIDTALAISKMRHFFLRANGDSTEVDSVITDSIPTDSVPVAEEPVKPRYVIDADGNVVLGVDSVGSEPDFILPFTFLPYGGDTYYYVKATNGVCMAIDSLHAVSMKPDNKLKTHIEMDGFDSEALKNNGVYEVAEGAELYLVANTLTFDMLYSYEYENNFQWATNTDNAFWMSSLDTMPAVVRPFAENLTFKVSDSVMFYLEDTTFACRYTESVDVRTVSGIKPADVFTPNGDAYNETWGIDGLSSYEHVNIYVFNRWGGRVWQFSGSGLEYAANQWNGRNAKNKPLPSGTYYYVIQCSSDKLGGKKKTGPVTIVR